ncbi:hypothetical protein AMTR_s00041p00201900 [Amborella trichopoda]|uniref:Uncharacterized protein n=1 Tax=Amborella trichopoda TaxID=13333 RepID=W1PYN1_AMBTC|nr:hypothetical protein AMTR_s00041p00201900 [Amborella trichopoda]
MASTSPRVSFTLRVGSGKRCRIRVEEEVIHQTKTSSEEEPKAAVLRNLFELSIDSGRIIMELYSDMVPITAENFRPCALEKRDENFEEKHKGFGVLFMATGEEYDDNGSKFAIGLNKNTLSGPSRMSAHIPAKSSRPFSSQTVASFEDMTASWPASGEFGTPLQFDLQNNQAKSSPLCF